MRAIPIEAGLLKELERLDEGRHLGRLALFAALYLGAAALATAGAARGVPLWALAPLYLLAAAALHGVSLFTHEGVHGTLAARPAVNHLLASACALPVLQNFAAYRVLHLRHHADLGRGLDPDFYANYTGRPWLEALMHAGRLLLGYPAYVTMIPILGWRHGTARERAAIAAELAALAGLAAAAWAWVPHAALLHGWLLPMLVINTLVNVRGMSQHTFLAEPEHPVRGSRSILAGPVVRFFMCNENFHLEHHLYPRVPWYNLPRLHALLRPALEAQGAPFIASYGAFVRLALARPFRG